MNKQPKEIMYGQLMNEHRNLMNRMSEIKGSSIDLNESQLKEIENIKRQMEHIFKLASQL
jgi:hypothetical protein